MALRKGEQYISALRDGRRVFQGGRNIDDVPSHPGFAGTVSTLSCLYDLQHSSELAGAMATTRDGEPISFSYLPPTTTDELLAKRRNVEVWSERTFGVMGRFPGFCSELTVGLLDAADWLATAGPQFAENARRYYRYCAQNDLCLTHALNDHHYDHAKRIGQQRDRDLILRVVRETSDGPIVRGLRNLATLAPISDEALVYPNRPRIAGEEDYAFAFAIPLNAPGLTVICRDLYAEGADPERLPLTARFDEVDTSLIFDDVLVPWERVFIYRNPSMAAQLHGRINLWAGYSTNIRLLSKMEVLVGVADLLNEWAGNGGDRGMQVRIGQLIADTEVVRACLTAAEAAAYRTAAGYLAPRLSSGYRLHGIDASDRAHRLLQEILTSSLVLTAGASDLADPQVGPLVQRYFPNNAPSTRDHLRLLAVAGDLVQSAFAARNVLYERLHSGEPDNQRQRLFGSWDRSAVRDRLLEFIRDQMGERLDAAR